MGRGRVGRGRAGCAVRGSAAIQGWSREPQTRRSALAAMGRGYRRTSGSPALGLLLLLRLPWQVWGAEAFRGEWECKSEGQARSLSGMEGLNFPGNSRPKGQGKGRAWEGLRGNCPGTLN